MPKKKPPEEVLAAKVITWLEADGWDVYQEVRPYPTYPRAIDIVAVKPNNVWAIECKTSLNLEVMAQAKDAQIYANTVSIAVPSAKRSDGRTFAVDVLTYFGIGCIFVNLKMDQIRVKLSPRPRPGERLRKVLCPEHKTHAKAGSRKGGQWTPFKATAEAIAEYVLQHPEGTTLKALEAAVKHHYKSKASFMRSIPRLVSKGVVKGVRLGPNEIFFPTNKNH